MAPDGKRRGKPRAKGVELPAWFLTKVREIADERKETLGENLSDLGRLLAEAIGKERAWEHSAVSRFLSEEILTTPMALAFAELFGIPRPFFTPSSFDEALGMQQVYRRHISADQKSRLAAMDQASKAAEADAKDQTPGVASDDEVRAGRRGRSRRTARSRS